MAGRRTRPPGRLSRFGLAERQAALRRHAGAQRPVRGVALDPEASPFLGGQLQRCPHGIPVMLGVNRDLVAPIHETGWPVGVVRPAVVHPPAVDHGDEGAQVVRLKGNRTGFDLHEGDQPRPSPADRPFDARHQPLLVTRKTADPTGAPVGIAQLSTTEAAR